MNKEFYALDVKGRNVIDKINQVVKKSFLHYYVFPNGIAVSDQTEIEGGFHFSHIKNVDALFALIPSEYPIKLDAKVIYETIKDHKKTIKGITIKDNEIYITTETEEFHIGTRLNADNFLFLKELYSKAAEKITHRSTEYLSESTIDSLLDGDVVVYGEGDLKVRVAKALFPHIKKKIDIGISFIDSETNLFEIVISINKDTVENFHVYTCIKY